MNTNYELITLATNNYIDSKGKALGQIFATVTNSVFVTSNDTLYIASASNDGDVKFTEYKLPTGNRILDEHALIDNLATAIAYNNYWQLIHRIDVLEDNADADADVIELLRIALDYIYPNKPNKPDSISALITLAMLPNSVYNISSDNLKSVLKAINDNKRDDFNKLITNIIQTRECDYIKNTTCDLNKANFDNIRQLATATTRKWNRRGITKSTLKDKDIFKQALLTVFESEYKLAILKKKSQKIEFII